MTKLTVVDFTATPGGFRVTFSKAVDVTAISLYDGGAGHLPATPSLSLAGVAWGGNVTYGSLVFNADDTEMTYLYPFGLLPDDTYTLTLVSGEGGFKDLDGVAMDGSGDGGSDNYTHEFTTSYVASNVGLVVGTICRGIGQTVDAAANGSTPSAMIWYGGIPITLTDGNNATAAEFSLAYDTTLLTISGAAVDTGTKSYANAPTGSTFTRTNHVVADGIATDTFAFATPEDADLGTGSPVTIGALLANVPKPAVFEDTYGKTQVLAVSSLTADGTLTIVGVDGLHVNCYIGNVTGTGGYGILDASLIGRVAGLTDTGFAAFPITDPVVLADILNEYSVGIGDSALVNQKMLGISTPSIPMTAAEVLAIEEQFAADVAEVSSQQGVILTGETVLTVPGQLPEPEPVEVRVPVSNAAIMPLSTTFSAALGGSQ